MYLLHIHVSFSTFFTILLFCLSFTFVIQLNLGRFLSTMMVSVQQYVFVFILDMNNKSSNLLFSLQQNFLSVFFFLLLLLLLLFFNKLFFTSVIYKSILVKLVQQTYLCICMFQKDLFRMATKIITWKLNLVEIQGIGDEFAVKLPLSIGRSSVQSVIMFSPKLLILFF